MLLTIKERLSLMDILPPDESFIMMGILDKLHLDLAPTEGEVEETGLRVVPVPGDPSRGQYLQDSDGTPVDISIGIKAHAFIIELLETLDTNKKIQRQHLTLYQKFVLGEETED